MVIIMTKDINKKMIEMINLGPYDEVYKECLIKLLLIELDNYEGCKIKYSDKYDQEILKDIQEG